MEKAAARRADRLLVKKLVSNVTISTRDTDGAAGYCEVIYATASSPIRPRPALQPLVIEKHRNLCAHDNSLQKYHNDRQGVPTESRRWFGDETHNTQEDPHVLRQQVLKSRYRLQMASKNNNGPHQHVAHHPRIPSHHLRRPDPLFFRHF